LHGCTLDHCVVKLAINPPAKHRIPDAPLKILPSGHCDHVTIHRPAQSSITNLIVDTADHDAIS
jgi:hypothetical protein